MPGPDPGIHLLLRKKSSKKMDGRTIKPGNDDFIAVSLGCFKIESIATNNRYRPGERRGP
jgi:hypothetical protein